MRQRVVLLLGCLLIGLTLQAADVKGRLVDYASRKPIDFANVSIYQADGKTLITGTSTDIDGEFTIYDLQDGKYVVVFSFMGYVEQRKEITIANNKNVQIGRVFLQEDTQQLQEVEVVGQGSTMRFELDKKVFSVDQNIASAGGSAADVLENIPSVDVDQEGNISMRNSESVEIWINGKPAGLTADNRAQVMEQLPAESIKEIEVITNPSAKFSPEGTAGIINIVMKKDRKAGYYGSVNAGLTYSLASPWNIPPGGNLGFNINVSKGPVDAYFNAGYRYRNSNGGSYTMRHFLNGIGSQVLNEEDITQTLEQEGTSRRKGGGMFLRAGADFRVGDYSFIGVSGFGMVSDPKVFKEGGVSNNTYLMTRPIDEFGEIDTIRYYQRNQSQNGSHPGGMATLDYRLEYQKHKLMVSASYGNFGGDNSSIYEQTEYIDDRHYIQEQTSTNRHNFVEVKADYEWKPTDQSRLEAGWNSTISWGPSISEAFDSVPEVGKTFLKPYYNEFEQPQQIHALYVTYGNRFWDRLSVQVGLRGEYAHWELSSTYYDQAGALQTLQADTTYWQLYPSAYISYSFPNNHELQLNYTRRVDRPWGGQLNPRVNMADSTNISYGNPLLYPSYSSSLELNYLKTWEKHTISAGVFYRFRDDIIQRISYYDAVDDLMKSTHINISKRQEVGLELVGKNRFWNDFLQLTTSVNVYYNTMTAAEYFDETKGMTKPVLIPSEDIFSWSARINASFLFTKTFTGQLSASYRSPRVVAQGTSSHSYSIDLGLRKTFLERKLALAFNVRDILNSRARSNTKWGEGFWQFSENRWNSRMVSVSLTYNFGNMRQKPPKRMSDGGASMMMGGDEGGGED